MAQCDSVRPTELHTEAKWAFPRPSAHVAFRPLATSGGCVAKIWSGDVTVLFGMGASCFGPLAVLSLGMWTR